MKPLVLLPLLLMACSDGPPTTPETRPVENPNAGNTAIYDVDPDDPYEIANDTFLDLSPGMLLPYAADDVTRIIEPTTYDELRAMPLVSDRGDTLGSLLLRADSDTIHSIRITSPNVVTQNGIRPGFTYGELTERLGAVSLLQGASPQTAYAFLPPLYYLLDRPFSDTISNDAVISEIVLRR